jgi:hypothetical protein
VVDDESVDATLTEDSAEDNGGEVDWQKRYTDTQAAYTKNQQALAEAQRVWEDEQALLTRVQETFPHLLAEEEDTSSDDQFDDEDDTETTVPAAVQKELDELRQWRQSIDTERGQQLFKQHLSAELGDRDLPVEVHNWIHDRTMALGANQQALKQAVKEFDSLSEQIGQQHMESIKKSKRAPHVSAAGKAATQVPDPRQRLAYMTQKYADLTTDD